MATPSSETALTARIETVRRRGPARDADLEGGPTLEGYRGLVRQRFELHRELEARWRSAALSPLLRYVGPNRPHFPAAHREELDRLDGDASAATSGSVEAVLRLWDRLVAAQPDGILGLWYAIAGNLHRHRGLAARWRLAIGLGHGGGSALDPLGAEHEVWWNAFRGDLDAAPLSPESRDAAVAAALHTEQHLAALSREWVGRRRLVRS